MKAKDKIFRTIRSIFIVFLKIAGIVFILISILSALVLVPAVQNRLTPVLNNVLSENLKTETAINAVRLSPSGNIILKNLLVKDDKRDTLIYAERARINLSLFKLLKKQVHLTLNLQNVIARFDIENLRISLIKSNQFNLNLDAGRIIVADRNTNLKQLKIDLNSIEVMNTMINLVLPVDSTGIGIDQPLNQRARDSTTASLMAEARLIRFRNFDFKFSHPGNETIAHIVLPEFVSRNVSLDLDSRSIQADFLQLSKSAIELNIPHTGLQARQSKDNRNLIDKLGDFSWKINISKAEILQNNLRISGMEYDRNDKTGYFFTNPEWSNINLVADNFKIERGLVNIEIESSSLSQRNDMSLNSMKGNIRFRRDSLEIKGLSLVTNHSRIDFDLKCSGISGINLSQNPERIGLQLFSGDIVFDRKELEFFIGRHLPFLSKYDQVSLKCNGDGTLGTLKSEILF